MRLNPDIRKPPPAVNAAQVNVTSSGDIQVIVRESGPGEPWFQMLRREFEDGTWARLLDRHRNLLPVMCALRDRDTGLAYAPAADFLDAGGVMRPGLLARTGMSRSPLYSALAEMTIDPASVPLGAPDHAHAAAGLLARCGRDLFAVLPDRVFAGRRPLPEALSPVLPAGLARKSVLPAGQKSCQQDSPRLLHRETRARSDELRIQNSSSERALTTTSLSVGDQEAAVAMLTVDLGQDGKPGQPGRLDRADALRMLASTGATLEQVRKACKNATYRHRQGKLSNWGAYIRRCLENGVSLFGQLERGEDARLRVRERLARLSGELGDEQTCSRLTVWFGALNERQLQGIVESREWRQGDEEFWGRCVEAACRGGEG